MIDYCIIGKRIKKARKNLGLTQENLAEKISVSTNYLSKIDGGHEKPNLEMPVKSARTIMTAGVTTIQNTIPRSFGRKCPRRS